MFVRMLKLPEEVRTKYDLSSLQLAVTRRAVPGRSEAHDDRVVGPIIFEYYGATEGGFTVHHGERVARAPGLGRASVLGEVHILDEDDNECPTGEPGTWFEPDRRAKFEYYKDPRRRRPASTATVGAPSATSATSTTRATSTSPTARRS